MRHRPARARGRARAGAGVARGEERRRCARPPRPCARRRRRSSPPTPSDCRSRARGRPAGCVPRPARARRASASRPWPRASRRSPRCADPVGTVLAQWTRPNGLALRARARAARRHRHHLREPAQRDGRCRRAVPQGRQRGDPARRLGEPSSRAAPSRPCLARGLRAAGLPEAAIQLVPTTDREAVGLMLEGLDGAIDVIVPRGGKSLVARVQEEARVPVFAHLEGICHTYVDRSADLDMAKTHRRQRQDAAHRRVRRHRDAAGRSQGARGLPAGADRGAASRPAARCAATRRRRRPMPRVKPATEQDWSTEYLDAIIAVKTVDGVDGAIAHIAQLRLAAHRLHRRRRTRRRPSASSPAVDSAIVLHNASTQFADGGEFGMGAEIGIATGRCTRAAPSASSSSPASSTSCAATAKSGRRDAVVPLARIGADCVPTLRAARCTPTLLLVNFLVFTANFCRPSLSA